MAAESLQPWAHHLAQRHLADLANLTSSSPPASELPVLLHLADQVPSSQLPLEVLLDLAVVCPPWPQDVGTAGRPGSRDPIPALFGKHWVATNDERRADLASLASAIVSLGAGSPASPIRVVLIFALLRMGGRPAVEALLALESVDVQSVLEELSRTYASDQATLSVKLFCLHALSLLLGVSLSEDAGSTPLPPLDAVAAALPAPSDELPRPFTSLWSDGETLFGLSGRVIDAPAYGNVAMQLLQLEGDRKEWETEALRLEQNETVYPSMVSCRCSPNDVATKALTFPCNQSVARPQPAPPTDPAVLASIEQIQSILPDLSAAFIAGAVAHPYFTAPPPAGAPVTSAEERIIEAIFDSAPLPAPTIEDPMPITGSSTPAVAAEEAEFFALARARREQAEQATGGAVDTSQVYRKDTSQVVPQISEAMPQSVRESIMRLVEVQREEQEEEEREERERLASRRAAVAADKLAKDSAASKAPAGGGDDDDDDLEEDEHVGARMRGTALIGVDGEESGDDEDEDATRAVRLTRKSHLVASTTRLTQTIFSLLQAPSGPVPIDSDGLLEDLYMSNKKVFDRDGATRRGKDRAALKEKTGESPTSWAGISSPLSLTPVYPAGLSDEQIEGWRIMLERNPRRMASIQARLGMFTPSASATSANSAKPTPVPNGNHTNGNGGGGGGANRGRGGGGDRGGGRGGRGGRGENKGSRGHQNAARKRGADRKAAMQGPKA
jgi:hypothetical protein